LSEFIVACTVYCILRLPYGVTDDDDYTYRKQTGYNIPTGKNQSTIV